MGFCLALASHALIFTDEKNSEKKKIVVGPRHKMTETFLCFFRTSSAHQSSPPTIHPSPSPALTRRAQRTARSREARVSRGGFVEGTLRSFLVSSPSRFRQVAPVEGLPHRGCGLTADSCRHTTTTTKTTTTTTTTTRKQRPTIIFKQHSTTNDDGGG